MDDTAARPAGNAYIANNSAPHLLSSAELDVPSLRADDVHVRLSAIGVNFIDYLVASQNAASARVTPGCEAVGRIVATGESVHDLPVGQRVCVFAMGGCYASEIVAHRRFVVPIPDGIPDITAAAFLISYATAHHALFGRAALQPGETVVITGAAGATGLAAVELAALRGAKVIACAGSDEKLAWTQKAGAAFGIDYTREHTAKRISELAPSGFHVLVDTVSGPLFGELLTVAAFNARICVVGATATGGAFAPVDPMALLGRELTVLGVSLGAHRDAFPQRFAEDVSELFGLLARGTLNPRVSHVLPFSEAGEALRLITRRENIGKVVLQVEPRAASA